MSDNAVTSADASCAPPPQTIIGRLAAPRIFAARRTASASIFDAGSGSGACSVTGPAFAPHVDGAFEHCRSGAAGAHGAQRERRLPRSLLRPAQQRRVIDDAFDNAVLVANLMQMAEPAADIGLGYLSDQAEHRRVRGIGGEEAGRGVEEAGTRHDGKGLRPAGGERRAQRHQRRALLVAGMETVRSSSAARNSASNS